MHKRIVLAALFVCFVSTSADAQWGRYKRRGTIVGGVAGAAIGAAIGDRSNNEALGAVIGGVTGAAIGNNVGEQRDYRSQQQQYSSRYNTHSSHIHNQPIYGQPVPVVVHGPVQVAPPIQVVAPSAVGPQPISQIDVLNMLRSGLTETAVGTQIQRRGMAHHLSVNDVIGLHQHGVSERLIEHMQASVVAGAASHSPGFPTGHVQPSQSYSQPMGYESQSPVRHESPSPVISSDVHGRSILAPGSSYREAN